MDEKDLPADVPEAAGLRPVGSVTLGGLLLALGSEVVDPVDTPNGLDPAISSVALIDSADLALDSSASSEVSDVYLHVGIGESDTALWLRGLGALPDERKPRAVLSKMAQQSTLIRAAARDAGVALIGVHPQARWDRVFSLVRGVLERDSLRRRMAPVDDDLLATDTDLFGLAQTVAQATLGMVSIEDEYSHVLAYSASDEAADELRRLSILRREGPADYLRRLHQTGVFDALRHSDDVIDVPADLRMGTKRRLVVGIRDSSREGPGRPRLLGAIWVQQGERPLAPTADDVLRGASAIAARVISRILNAPTTEALLIQRLFGARGSGVDVPSLASALSIATAGPAAVVGFASMSADESRNLDLHATASVLRLHASSFRRDSLATVVGDRVFVLFPQFQSVRGVTSWTQQVIARLEQQTSAALRAAIAAPVGGLGDVAAARLEVDRVLDGTEGTGDEGRVTTLADSRTTVLLGEILDLIGGHDDLRDPRLGRLIAYDEKHSSNLRDSIDAYLGRHGDVRHAAKDLQIHPNTLRYRVRRAEEITGIDFGDSAGRLLTELQLAMHRRRREDPLSEQ